MVFWCGGYHKAGVQHDIFSKDLARESQMQRTIGWLIVSGALFLGILALSDKPLATADSVNENECVKCHTNVKGLIRLGWEIEKVKGKPIESQEIAGEG
jgi:hypothetical protein